MQPVLFKIGNFPVQTFGLVMVIAFFAGLWLAGKRAAKYGIAKSEITDMIFWVIIAGVFGARIVFILQELPYFLAHKDQLFSLRFEGLTSFGALIFGFAAALIYTFKKKLPLLAMLDIMGPVLLLGHAIGRFGCLMNGCCYGGVCPQDAWYGVHGHGMGDLKFFPAQLIDSALNFGGLGLVLWIEKRRLRAGQLFTVSMALHGLSRFIYEFWRAGTVEQVKKGLASSTVMSGLGITEAQLAAGAIVVVSMGFFFYFGARAKAKDAIVPDAGQQPA